MGKKGDLSDIVVGAKRAGLSISELLIYWDFHTQPALGFPENGPKKRKYPVSLQFCGRRCLVDARGQRRMARLV